MPAWRRQQARFEKNVVKPCRHCREGKLPTGQDCPACNGTGRAKTAVHMIRKRTR